MDAQIIKLRDAEYCDAAGVKRCLNLVEVLVNQWTQGEIDDKKFVVDFLAQSKANFIWLANDKKDVITVGGLAGYTFTDQTAPPTPQTPATPTQDEGGF